MAYLSSLHFKIDGESFCDIAAGFSCSSVNTSKYSEIFGMPMAFMGVGYFIALLGYTFMKKKKGKKQSDIDRLLLFATIFVLIPSAYLTLVEIFILKNICVFCEFSKVLMLLVAGILFWKLKAGKAVPKMEQLGAVVVIGAFAAGVTWYIQSAPDRLNSYDNLAQCMTENNVVMYGSMTCAVCARTKDTFGASFEYIHEVECHPRGENPQVDLCLSKKVQKTPTWTIEVDGVELDRTTGFEGVQALARFAGCEEALETDMIEGESQ